MSYPIVRFGVFLCKRTDFVAIDDTATYARARVQLHGQGVILRDRLPGSDIRTKKQQVARAGEFLVAEIDAKVGGFGIVPPELEGAIVSSHYFLFKIDEAKCLRGWLDSYIRSGKLEDQVGARGSTNYAAIRPDHVLNFELPLPPIAEQRRIATEAKILLRFLDEARSLRYDASEQTASLWQAAANANFMSVRGPRMRLGDLVMIKGGGTPSKGNPFYWQGHVPWVTPKDMKVREIFDSKDHISDEATVASPAKLLEPGCVLIVVRGMILAHTVPAAVLRVRATINQDMKALLPNAKLGPEYLCTALWALNPNILALVERSTHDTRKLDTDRLLGLEIPVPSLEEQRRLVHRLGQLEESIKSLRSMQRASFDELESLTPAILNSAFNGSL